MNINTIGKRLSRFRGEAGLSQEQLSVKSGVPQGTISRLENAVHGTVEIDTIQALAAALGMTSSQLIGELEPAADPQIREMNILMQPLSAYEKKAALGAVKGIIEAGRKTG